MEIRVAIHPPSGNPGIRAGKSGSLSLIIIGLPLLLIALFLETVTLASGRYFTTLLAALLFTAMADCCFICAFRRGNLFAKLFSIVFLLPTLFIASDFFRRTGAFQ